MHLRSLYFLCLVLFCSFPAWGEEHFEGGERTTAPVRSEPQKADYWSQLLVEAERMRLSHSATSTQKNKFNELSDFQAKFIIIVAKQITSTTSKSALRRFLEEPSPTKFMELINTASRLGEGKSLFTELEKELSFGSVAVPTTFPSLETLKNMPLKTKQKWRDWLVENFPKETARKNQDAFAIALSLVEGQTPYSDLDIVTPGNEDPYSTHAIALVADARKKSRPPPEDRSLEEIESIAMDSLKILLPTHSLAMLSRLPKEYRDALLALWTQMSHRPNTRLIYQNLLMSPTIEKITATLQAWNPDYHHFLTSHTNHNQAQEERAIALLLEKAKREGAQSSLVPPMLRNNNDEELERVLEQMARALATSQAQPEIAKQLAAQSARILALPLKDRPKAVQELQDAIVKSFYEGRDGSPSTRLVVERLLREKAALQYIKEKLGFHRVQFLTEDKIKLLSLSSDPTLQSLLKSLYRKETLDEIRSNHRKLLVAKGHQGENLETRLKNIMDYELAVNETSIAAKVNDMLHDAVGDGNTQPGRLTIQAKTQQNTKDFAAQCVEKLNEVNGTDEGKGIQQRLSATYESEANELDQRAVKLQTEGSDEKDENKLAQARALRQSADRLRQLAEIKKSGKTFIPVITELPGAKNRVNDWKEAERKILQTFAYWGKSAIKLEHYLRDLQTQLHGLGRTLASQKEGLEKAKKDGARSEITHGYEVTAKFIECEMRQKSSDLHGRFIQLDALTTFQNPDRKLSEEELRVKENVRNWLTQKNIKTEDLLGVGTRAIENEPCVGVLGKANCSSDPRKVPSDLESIVMPIFQSRVRDIRNHVKDYYGYDPYEKGELFSRGRCGAQPTFNYIRHDFLDPDGYIMKSRASYLAVGLIMSIAKEEALKKLKTLAIGLEEENRSETLSFKETTEAHYRDLARYCMDLMNQNAAKNGILSPTGNLFDVTDIHQVYDLANSLMEVQRAKDQGSFQLSGLVKPGDDDVFKSNFVEDQIENINNRLLKLPIKLSSDQMEGIVEELIDGAVNRKKHDEQNIESLMAKLTPYGFSWDGANLDFKKANFHHYNTREKRQELKRILTELGKYGKYPQLHTTPWEEAMQWLFSQWQLAGFHQQFELNESTTVFVGHPSSANVDWNTTPETVMSDWENAWEHMTFRSRESQRKTAQDLYHQLVGNDPKEMGGMFRTYYDSYRRPIRVAVNRLIPSPSEVENKSKALHDYIKRIREVATHLTNMGNVKVEIEVENADGQTEKREIPAWMLGMQLEGQLYYGIYHADRSVLYQEIKADLHAALEFNTAMLAVDLLTLGASKFITGPVWIVKALANAGKAYRLSLATKATLDQFYSWKQGEDVTIPWSQWTPQAHKMALTFGAMTPVSGLLGAAGLEGGFVLNSANGILSIAGTSFVIDTMIYGEDAGTAGINALKMAPYGIGIGPAMGNVGAIGSRPWLSAIAGTAFYSGMGVSNAWLQHMTTGYHDRLGNKLEDPWEIALDSAVNTFWMDAAAGIGAARDAKVTYIKGQILRNPELFVKEKLLEVQKQHAEKAEAGSTNYRWWRNPLKAWRQGRAQKAADKLSAEEQLIWEALAEVTPKEITDLLEGVAKAKDPKTERKRADQLVELFTEASGFKTKNQFLDTLREYRNQNSGWAKQFKTLSQITEELRSMARKKIATEAVSKGKKLGDILSDPLFTVDGVIDPHAVNDIPTEALELGSKTTSSGTKPVNEGHMKFLNQLADQFNIKGEELHAFMRGYRGSQGNSIREAIQSMKTLNPGKVKQMLAEGKISVEMAKRHFPEMAEKALSSLEGSELQTLAKKSKSDYRAADVVKEAARVLGISPKVLTKALEVLAAEGTVLEGKITDPISTTKIFNAAAKNLVDHIMQAKAASTRQARLDKALKENPFLATPEGMRGLPIDALNLEPNSSHIELLGKNASAWGLKPTQLIEFLNNYRHSPHETLSSAIEFRLHPAAEKLKEALMSHKLSPEFARFNFSQLDLTAAVNLFNLRDLENIQGASDESNQALASLIRSNLGITEDDFKQSLRDLLRSSAWKREIGDARGGFATYTASRYVQAMDSAGKNTAPLMDKMISLPLFRDYDGYRHVPLKYLDANRPAHKAYIEDIAKLNGHEPEAFLTYFKANQFTAHDLRVMSWNFNDQLFSQEKYDAENKATHWKERFKNRPETVLYWDIRRLVTYSEKHPELKPVIDEIATKSGFSPKVFAQAVIRSQYITGGDPYSSWRKSIENRIVMDYRENVEKLTGEGRSQYIDQIIADPFSYSDRGMLSIPVNLMDPNSKKQQDYVKAIAKKLGLNEEGFLEYFKGHYRSHYNFKNMSEEFKKIPSVKMAEAG